MLNIHIETRLLEREGRAVTNFEERLPAPHSDLAHATLKDPYLFDFLGVGKEADEREIETAIVGHISRFLLELGAGIGVAEYQLLAALPAELQPVCRASDRARIGGRRQCHDQRAGFGLRKRQRHALAPTQSAVGRESDYSP